MLKMLFNISNNKYHKVITVLGLKFKLRNNREMLKDLQYSMEWELPGQRSFIWANIDKYSTQEKIWLLSRMCYKNCGYFPNFKNPKTFNEKLNWLKLNYYNPEENICIDKHLVKDWVKDKLGEGYTIPLLGVYKDVNDIDFESLPNRFVVKSPFSGGALGVKYYDKNKNFDIDKAKFEINEMIQKWHNLYYWSLSRGYKEIEPKIIIEEYIEQINGELYDYKFMCFHGEPQWVLVCHGRDKHTIYENYDMNWNLFVTSSKSAKKSKTKCPKNFDKMVDIAKRLSKTFPFVRVDLYNVKGKIYLGEMSFTPASGFGVYSIDMDYKIGEWLNLNKLNPMFLNVLPEFSIQKEII